MLAKAGLSGKQAPKAPAIQWGILAAADLARYAPKVFDERPARYRGLDYVTSNDTVGYETLGILEHFPLGELGAGSAEHYHLLAEAMGHAFADNATFSCDPDHTETPVAELGSQSFAAERAAAGGVKVNRGL